MNQSSPDSTPKPKPRKDRRLPYFWRAMRFLAPHRRLVIISIACAFLVGLTFTTGLSTMLPILRVLMNGDTVRSWAGRIVVEQRLGVKLADDPLTVRVDRIKTPGPAADAGYKPGDTLGNADLLHQVASRQQMTLGNTSLPPLKWWQSAFYRTASAIPDHPVKAIAVVFGVMFSLGLVGNFVRFYQEYYSDKAGILAVNDIRRKLYDHVLHIPMGFFGLKGTSDVTSRLVQDAQGLQDGFKTVLGQSIQEPIKAAMAFGLALWFDWRLTMFIVLFGPVMFAIIKKFGKKMRRASRAALQSSAVMFGQLEASLAGVRVIKAASAESHERKRYTRIMDGLVNEQLKMSRIDAMSTPILEMLTLLVVGAIVLYATYLVRIKHTLDATTFFGLMACLMAIGESMRKFSKVNNALQKSNAAAARIFETLDVPVERPRDLRTRKTGSGFVSGDGKTGTGAVFFPRRLPAIQRDIVFENISFTYPEAPSPALRNINLTVPRGQSVAVVGRNGSGKTTLLALLPRFYNPDSGKIFIDGADISTVTLKSLRSQIGIVTQEPILFPGTIAQNIAYGLPQTPRDQIIAAARQAFAHDFILEKPNGYDTLLEGIGSQLSGGQRQRLCIARAILRQTPILILDEATSQVDAESEHLIQQAIERLMHQRTTFVIAHRFSTILSADTIVVLERGQIVGQGKHEDLLRTCDTYKQLYDRQIFAAPVEAQGQEPLANSLSFAK
jgi:ABC-type multidrug transport system fused ATPase/permease subunit